MIAYTMLGTNDKDKAFAFYDALFADTDIKRLFQTPAGGQFYGRGGGSPMICITAPYDDGQANFGNGTMVAMKFDTTEEIDALHAKALELGAVNEGEPGWRAPDIFYGAYFRDPDGNKLCACKMNM
jgi:catechol 2,3-dioxygenase-like lactoylglutathione lyase family enzyme